MESFNLSGNIVDIHNREIYHGRIEVVDGRIGTITNLPGQGERYILPGFVDAHVHIESSMLVPAEFARMATIHGTVATVSDPHEIAKVLGVEGVHFMIENAQLAALKIMFGAPSCVPATAFETVRKTSESYKTSSHPIKYSHVPRDASIPLFMAS